MIALALVLVPFVIFSAFLLLCGARKVLASGVELPVGMSAVIDFWLLVGYPADALFNWTWGALVIFGRPWQPEWRGVTFSSHVQWRVDNGRWDDRTQMWTAFLNAGDAGHIKTPAVIKQ